MRDTRTPVMDALVEFVLGLETASLPTAVVEAASRSITDWLGAAIRASRVSGGQYHDRVHSLAPPLVGDADDRGVDEADYVHGPGSLNLDLGDVFRLDNRVAIGLVLIAFGDLVVADDLTAFLAALVVSDWTEVILVKLVEVNLFRRLDRVVDANRYGD